MQIETRRTVSLYNLKRRVLEKLSTRRKLKIGSSTIMFLILSYYAYLKKYGKMAKLKSLMENKRAIYREHIAGAHQTMLEKIRVKRRQKTLDEMLKRR